MAVTAASLEQVKAALSIEDSFTDHDTQLTRLIGTAEAMANDQAPDAPDAIAVEAQIRFIAWSFEGPQNPGNSGWQACGAKGLLSPWTVRRGNVIKQPDEEDDA